MSLDKEQREHLKRYCKIHGISNQGMTFSKDYVYMKTKIKKIDAKTKSDILHITKGSKVGLYDFFDTNQYSVLSVHISETA